MGSRETAFKSTVSPLSRSGADVSVQRGKATAFGSLLKLSSATNVLRPCRTTRNSTPHAGLPVAASRRSLKGRGANAWRSASAVAGSLAANSITG